MIRHLITVLTLAGSALPPSTLMAAEQPAGGAVVDDLALIAVLRPETQLRAHVMQMAVGSPLFDQAVEVVGPEMTCSIIQTEANAAIARDLPEWQAGMIAIHREVVPASDLQRAVAAGPKGAAAILDTHSATLSERLAAQTGEIIMRGAVLTLKPLSEAVARSKTRVADQPGFDKDGAAKRMQSCLEEFMGKDSQV